MILQTKAKTTKIILKILALVAMTSGSTGSEGSAASAPAPSELASSFTLTFTTDCDSLNYSRAIR